MVLKLYGSSRSPAVKLVAAVLREKQVPFEWVLVNLAEGEQRTEDFLEKNPFGKIPVIDDDGFIVYESRAIARYVAEKYAEQGTNLIPTDFKSRIGFEQAAAVEQNNFHPHAQGAVIEKWAKPTFRGLPPDEAVYEENLKKLSASLDAYDRILGKQKYLAGEELTLVDLFHLPFGSLIKYIGSDVLDTRSNVARWYTEISSRPSWVAVKDGVNGNFNA